MGHGLDDRVDLVAGRGAGDGLDQAGDPGPLGNECAGVVTAVGEGVESLEVGDDVVAMVDRSFANWVLAPESLTVRKPASLTYAEAATIPVTFLTAQYALRDLARIKKGDRVLVPAVTGGVGMAAARHGTLSRWL